MLSVIITKYFVLVVIIIEGDCCNWITLSGTLRLSVQ